MFRLLLLPMSYVLLVVCPFFFPSVWLLATSQSHKNYWSDRHDNFATDVSVDKEVVLKFWKSSALDPDLRFLKTHIFIARKGSFHNVAHISKMTPRVVIKFTIDVSLDKDILHCDKTKEACANIHTPQWKITHACFATRIMVGEALCGDDGTPSTCNFGSD